jgi:Flp pilus assembly protein TadG
MRSPKHTFRWISTDHARRGTAAIEFALAAPLLLILLTGIVELGMAAFQAMQVQTAAEAGALYATAHGGGDLDKISQAVTNATSTAGITASPAPQVYCGCPGSGGITSQGSDCSSTCSDGKPPGKYATVSATITRQTFLPFLNLPLPDAFTRHSVVRVQ